LYLLDLVFLPSNAANMLRNSSAGGGVGSGELPLSKSSVVYRIRAETGETREGWRAALQAVVDEDDS
jgi:hypothetical protein